MSLGLLPSTVCGSPHPLMYPWKEESLQELLVAEKMKPSLSSAGAVNRILILQMFCADENPTAAGNRQRPSLSVQCSTRSRHRLRNPLMPEYSVRRGNFRELWGEVLPLDKKR